MGYYSSVALIMKKNDFNEMNEAFREKFKDDDNENGLFYDCELRPADDNMICYWDDIKWYDDYENIKWVLGYLANMDDEGKPWGLLRVGEDASDVEEEYSGNGGFELMNNYMYIKKEITFC